MLRYLLILICITPTLFLFGQYDEAKWNEIMTQYDNAELHETASLLLSEGYYANAEKIIDKQLLSDGDNANLNYRKGFIQCEGKHHYDIAIQYFEKAKPFVKKNYDAFGVKERNAPLDLYFFLAKSYHRIGNTEQARTYYNEFLSVSSSNTTLELDAEVAIQQLDNAARLTDLLKKNVSIVNIGDVVNSEYPEYSPVISLDGNALYFTTRKQWDGSSNKIDRDPQSDFYPEDIFVSYKDENGDWTTPVRMEFCQEDQNEASVSVSTSERKVYIYQDIVGNGDLFYSEFKNNRFSKINTVNNSKLNDKEAWDTHCFVTPDGRNMYFSSNRKGGYGGRDLYRMVLLPGSVWSEPVNLGPSINSANDEDAPFMSIDNKTLYFASNGPKSVGGFDIFISIVDGSNQWSDPVNLGFPINSYDDDLFYTETIDGRRGYLTSVRPDTKGEKDIYEVNNDYLNKKYGHYIKGNITTTTGEQIPEDLVVVLDCLDCESDLFDLSSYPNLRAGYYANGLQPCNEYEVVLTKKDGSEEFHRTKIHTDCAKDFEEIIKNFEIDIATWTVIEPKDSIPGVDTTSTKVDTNVVVTNPDKTFEPLKFKHHFSYNANKLDTQEGELNAFIKQIESQLAEGKRSIVIHISSSASYVPTKTFKNNKDLAKLRAENMRTMLSSHFKNSKQVKIVIDNAIVSGPAYSNDKDNEQKYVPYQFVEMKTE